MGYIRLNSFEFSLSLLHLNRLKFFDSFHFFDPQCAEIFDKDGSSKLDDMVILCAHDNDHGSACGLLLDFSGQTKRESFLAQI